MSDGLELSSEHLERIAAHLSDSSMRPRSGSLLWRKGLDDELGQMLSDEVESFFGGDL